MGSEHSENERLMNLETRTENIEKVILRMEAKMDAWQMNFVSKELLEEKLKARDREIDRLSNEQQRMDLEKAQKKDIERLEQEKSSYKNTLPLWAAAFISAVALIYSFWPRK